MSNLLSLTETAKNLNCSQLTVRRMVKSGKIKAHRVGTRIKISPEAIEAYKEANLIRVVPRKINNTQPNENNETQNQ